MYVRQTSRLALLGRLGGVDIKSCTVEEATQGSVATDLRQDGTFIPASSTVHFRMQKRKNYKNWNTLAKVIIKIKVVHF